MKNLEALTKEQANEESREIFNQIEKKLGKVPNIYATIGNSSKALAATLNIGETIKQGEFSGKEIEAIALAVAQANSCDYCLAAHTVVGKMQGFSLDDTVAIRSGVIKDAKLKALTDLAKAITETRGYPEPALVESFYDNGYNQAALAELIVLIAANIITNYTNHLAGTEIDFELAPQLAEA